MDLQHHWGESRVTSNSGTPHPLIDKFGFVKFSGGKVEFTGSYKSLRTIHKEYGFVRGSSKLSKERPYAEIKIVALHPKGELGLGVCGKDVFVGELPGWPAYPSIAYHSDDGRLFSHENNGQGRKFGKRCKAGDRMGCGVLFSARGTAETLVFTRNSELVGRVPISDPGMLYLVAGSIGSSVIELDFEATFPEFSSAATFQKKGETRTFSDPPVVTTPVVEAGDSRDKTLVEMTEEENHTRFQKLLHEVNPETCSCVRAAEPVESGLSESGALVARALCHHRRPPASFLATTP